MDTDLSSLSSFSPNTTKSSEISFDSTHDTCSNDEMIIKKNEPLIIKRPASVMSGHKSVDSLETPTDEASDSSFRKRTGTWPLKENEKDNSGEDYDSKLAKKLKTELGLDSGKQLKNPWGNLSYSQMIERAIESSPWKSLTLKEIYRVSNHRFK